MKYDIKGFKSIIEVEINGQRQEIDISEICGINEKNIDQELLLLSRYYTFFSHLYLEAEKKKNDYVEILGRFEAEVSKRVRKSLLEQSKAVTEKQIKEYLDSESNIINKRHKLIELKYEADKLHRILRQLEMKERSLKTYMYKQHQEKQMYLEKTRVELMKNNEGGNIDPTVYENYKDNNKNI